MNTEYKLSNKSGTIWILGPLIGFPASFLLSIIYAYIDVYNPLVYLAILVYLGYLFGIFMLHFIIVKVSKCRNKTASIIFGAILGVFTIYTNWVCFIYAFSQKMGGELFFSEVLNPETLWLFMNIIAVDGWYSLFGTTISGGVLWAIWGIEALGILGVGLAAGSYSMHESVFCENCNHWTDDINFDLRLSMQDDPEKVQTAIKENIELLLEIPVISEGENPHIRLNINHCQHCHATSTLDIDLIKYKQNDEGEIEEDEEDFSPVFVLTEDLYQKFLQRKAEALNQE